MKNSVVFTGILLVMSVFGGYSQTPKERIKIKSTINKEFHDVVSNYIKDFEQKREDKVKAYIDLTKEDRVILLGNGGSKYLVDISSEGVPLYYQTDNSNASAGTLTSTMYGLLGLNMEGQDMIIGVWDENRALGTHQEFTTSATNNTSRMSYGDNAITGSSTDHATHVAGTMVARGAVTEARGMAFKANIVSYNWANDLSEVQDASGTGMLLTNHSYGIPMFNSNDNFQLENWRPGCYTSSAIAWDLIAYANPMTLSVVSAGNEGSKTPPSPLAVGLDKLVDNKVSKNNLVVANATGVMRDASGNLISVTINSSSSIGPSDDLRIKPDIAGIGTNVYSSTGASNNSYATLSGTSMAAPNVSGSLLLLQQYYNSLYGNFMRASTLKGLACLTADDGGNEGPDPYFGWGLLNIKAAADLIKRKGENKAILEENIINTGEVYSKTITLTSPGTLLAGICWTDYPGTSKEGLLNSTTSVLVNDLDIRISKEDGEIYYPWLLNPNNPSVAIKGNNSVDNVEIIRINNAEAGVYTITVSVNGSIYTPPGAGVQGQHYSLIATSDNATLSVNPIEAVSDLLIYPNPTYDILYFNMINHNYSNIEIYDVVGKRVLSTTINNNSIDISTLTPGVYMVKAYSESGNAVTKKIIKK